LNQNESPPRSAIELFDQALIHMQIATGADIDRSGV